jgi:hypothetical protein
MKNWNGTKGSGFKTELAQHIGCTIVDLGDFKGDVEFWHHQDTKEVAVANAELFADALNTIQKCGLLPSELKEQRDLLLDMLQKVSVIQSENYGNGMQTHLKMSGISSELNELINKIQNGD